MKQQLRTELLAKRRTLTKKWIEKHSNDMASTLYAWPNYKQAKVIMLFLSMADEPQMMGIIEHALQQGKTVCVPHMREQFGIMDAAILNNTYDLIRGRFNLLVPNPKKLNIINPNLVDMMIVPAVAYDDAGNRLGMGAGYYDRFILAAPQALLVGAIWSSHIISNVPVCEYDQPVHYLLTESSIMRCERNSPKI